MLQKSFDDLAKQVSLICRNLDYSCKFNYEHSYFLVFGRCSHGDGMYLTATLINVLCEIPEVSFNSVFINDDGKLCGLFFVRFCTDGNFN